MKNSITVFLLIALVFCGCDLNDDVPQPTLPPTVYGQLPTRNAIIQAAEAVGAANVQVIYYERAAGTIENITGGVNTNGGYQPSWWKQDRRWASSNYKPTLTGVYVLYDKTGKMHPNMTVKSAIRQLFESAGFSDATWISDPFFIETTTDNRWRLISLPTHADIINAVEQLGAGNVRINLYKVFVEHFFVRHPDSPDLLSFMLTVPADSNFCAHQGNVRTNPRMLWLSYEHPGLGSVVTNNDVEETIRELFIQQYGFESIDVSATGTLISASFPLPSFNQIRQAAEQSGVSNVQVSTYIANNVNVIPLNEGSRVTDIPVIVEINYDGPAISTVNGNLRALFANFNNVHIGNNATAIIPLPRSGDIWSAIHGILWMPIPNQPSVYTADSVNVIYWMEYPDSAAWNASIRIVMNGDGTNTVVDAADAAQAIIRLFNERGFSNLDINVSR